MDGTAIRMIKARTDRKKKGRIPLKMFSKVRFAPSGICTATERTVYTLSPTGGVISPISMDIITNIAK